MKRLFQALQHFFLSERGQLVFAVLLLILIPGALVLNTISTVQSSRRNMDIELQRKALLAERVFQATAAEYIDDPVKLQSLINHVRGSSEELWGIDVLIPEGENFKVVASAVPNSVGTVSKDLNDVIAWHQGEAIAYQTISSDHATVNQQVKAGDRDRRFWVVVSPITNTKAEKVALVSMKFSSQVVDELVQGSITRGTGILVGTILIVILLLALNSKLFQYTILFRKLKEVDQMKDEFISIASHELRTPITAIRGYMEMVLDGSMGPVSDQVKASLTTVNQSAERLGGLVEDLLNVSRIEQGRLDLEMTAIDPLTTIQGVMTELMSVAKEKQLKLAYDGPAKLPRIEANSDRLKQVLINLVGNGLKYTPKGSVTVQPEIRDELLRIKVADTGLGMSPADMERLFTKFYRIRTDSTQTISGTGLGLWITKQIVERMNGTIEVESIEGVGSQFIVSFPVLKGKSGKK